MNADTALAALTEGRIIEARPARGAASPARVIAQLGSTQYVFALLGDDKWRWTSANTYGNYERPSQAGCDASGWVVPVAWADVLNRLIDNA